MGNQKMIDFQWFALHTYSGHEKRVREQIDYTVRMEGMTEMVRRIEVPMRKMTQIRNGKKRETEVTLVPGYILVEMMATPEVVELISRIRGVTGFLGDGFVPTPISESEVNTFLGVEKEGTERKRAVVGLVVGDIVKVTDGLLNGSTGAISAVDSAHGKITVNIVVFGRATPTELDASQVEKVTDK